MLQPNFFLNLCAWKPGCSPVETLFLLSIKIGYWNTTLGKIAIGLPAKEVKINPCTCSQIINWTFLWKRSSSSNSSGFFREILSIPSLKQRTGGGCNARMFVSVTELLSILSNQSRACFEIFPQASSFTELSNTINLDIWNSMQKFNPVSVSRQFVSAIEVYLISGKNGQEKL